MTHFSDPLQEWHRRAFTVTINWIKINAKIADAVFISSASTESKMVIRNKELCCVVLSFSVEKDDKMIR